MQNDIIEKLKEFPFLSFGTYLDQDHIGIISHSDNQFVYLYSFMDIKTDDLKRKFLMLGNEWWWQSNRQIPINIFLKDRWEIFKPYLKIFVQKEFKHIYGPTLNMNNIMTKRVKRKITLIKSM